jgi:predicted transcriptional regulator
MVDYDDWFAREVEKGLAQIAAGQTLTHDEVGARLNEDLSGKQSRR